MRRVLHLVLAMGMAGLIGLTVAAAPETLRVTTESCPSLDGFDTPSEPLDQFAAALKSEKPVNILALGSSSMATPGGFVSQTMQALQAALPKAVFKLTVVARRGMPASEMLTRLTQALAKQQYPLVLWQTGTVEAVQGLRPEEFALTLQQGAEQAVEQGGNVVLINQQFSRFLRDNTDLDPYADAMAAAAQVPGADLFDRYDLMKTWVDEGVFDLEHTPKDEAAKLIPLLHHCLGDALARFLLTGTGR